MHRLNVHYHYKLSLVLPCANDQSPETAVVPFGTKYDLIGFYNKRGDFVSVKNGRITGFTNHRGQFVPVRKRSESVSIKTGRPGGLTSLRHPVVRVH
jgi:hypothetical protein